VSVDERFALAMVALAEVFRQQLTEQRIRLYAQALADLPVEAVEHAAQRAIKECRYFPTPAELRGFVQPVGDEIALLAWAGFQQAASKVGAWASLVVDDPCAAEALETIFGDWPTYCTLEGPAVGSRKAEFIAAYRAAQRKPQSSAVTLAGLTEGGWVGRLSVGGEVKSVPALRLALDAKERHGLPEAVTGGTVEGTKTGEGA
jgi:hypothetical protein